MSQINRKNKKTEQIFRKFFFWRVWGNRGVTTSQDNGWINRDREKKYVLLSSKNDDQGIK